MYQFPYSFRVSSRREPLRYTLCPGGESLRDGDALLSELTSLEFNASTCGELETDANFTGAVEKSCSILQVSVGVGQCGCNPPSGMCTVCPDSSSLVDPARVIDEAVGTTCQSVAARAAIVPASDPESCDLFDLSAAACSCPPKEISSTTAQADTFSPTSSPTTSDGAGQSFTATFASLGAMVLGLFVSMVV
jgi:hypothetical protein